MQTNICLDYALPLSPTHTLSRILMYVNNIRHDHHFVCDPIWNILASCLIVQNVCPQITFCVMRLCESPLCVFAVSRIQIHTCMYRYVLLFLVCLNERQRRSGLVMWWNCQKLWRREMLSRERERERACRKRENHNLVVVVYLLKHKYTLHMHM